jgi:hypothetical protein
MSRRAIDLVTALRAAAEYLPIAPTNDLTKTHILSGIDALPDVTKKQVKELLAALVAQVK